MCSLQNQINYPGKYDSQPPRRRRRYSSVGKKRAKKTVAWALRQTGLSTVGLADHLFDSGLIPNTTGTQNARSGLRSRVRYWSEGKQGMNPRTDVSVRKIVGATPTGQNTAPRPHPKTHELDEFAEFMDELNMMGDIKLIPCVTLFRALKNRQPK